MDIRALQFLVSVIDAGSMSAAARRLGTTRSNVSRRLKALEHDVQAQLLRRTTRRLEPTQIGWALYEHAAKITRELAALHATVEDLGRSLRGHLRVSVPTGLGQLVLGPLLLEFAEKYPDVSLQLTFSNYVFDLLSDEIDVALRLGSEPPSGYVSSLLATVDWALCMAPRYARERDSIAHPAELANYPALTPQLRDRRLVLRLLGEGGPHHVELKPRLQAADLLLVKRAVLQGAGLGVLPHYAVAEELAAGTLVEVLPRFRLDLERWANRLYLVTLPSPYPSVAARALMDHLSERFAADGELHRLLARSGPAQHDLSPQRNTP
jgi:DNA-binding transcriptional LysR family regulator